MTSDERLDAMRDIACRLYFVADKLATLASMPGCEERTSEINRLSNECYRLGHVGYAVVAELEAQARFEKELGT